MKLLILLMVFIMNTSYALDYTISKPQTYGERAPGNSDITVLSSHYGYWNGPIATPKTYLAAGKTASKIQFEFSSPDYFSDENVGHFAIGVRGDLDNLIGRGIVIGNVTGLPDVNRTNITNTIAIESFWGVGNYVYGPTTQSVLLKNNVEYRITVECKGSDASVLSYVLEVKNAENMWEELAHREVFDYYGLGKVDNKLDGWWMVEVFSTHAWTMNIRNLVFE